MRALLPVVSLVGASAWLAVSPVFAQQEGGAIAEQLFRDGRSLLEAGKVDEACEKFAASQRVSPAIGTLLNLAICREQQGRSATAWGLFADAEAQALRAGDPGRARIAHDHGASLAGQLRKIVIDLPAAPPGVVVKLDGIALPSSALGTEIPVDPGKHDIAVTAPGKKAWERTDVDVGSGPPPRVRVELEDAPPASTGAAAEPPTTASPQESPLGSFSQRWPAWIAFGVGAAGLVTGGVAGGLAFAKASDAKSGCQGSVCPEAAKGSADSAKSLATVSDIGFAIGAVGALAGAALWLWAPTRHPASAMSVVVGPTTVRLEGCFE
jgi:hypothetical protein